MNASGRKSLAVVIANAALFAATAGCASHRPERSETVPGKAPSSRPDSHLVFNPASSDLPPADVSRSAWPATAGGPGPGESVEYTELIIDRYGRNARNDAFVIRRFQSVRRGRSGR